MKEFLTMIAIQNKHITVDKMIKRKLHWTIRVSPSNLPTIQTS